MREGSNTAVVSDTADYLDERTVPESALPPNDPRVLHWSILARRRLVPLDFDLLFPPPIP